MTRKILRITIFLILSITILGQGQRFSRETRKYIAYDAKIIALQDVRLIKGDGSLPLQGQTVILEGGRITAIGKSGSIPIPEGAEILEFSGKSLLPGFIMFHEHMFYPAGGSHYNQQSASFPRLYLAGGVTFMRTAGSMEPYSDLNLKKNIDSGRVPGPRMDVTSPYFNGPGLGILSVKALDSLDHARTMVAYWDYEGVAITSTLPVFETMTPGRPVAPDAVLDTMLPEVRDQYLRSWSRIAGSTNSDWPELFKKGMELEKRFFEAGGLLLVGTDPTGYGGVVAGHANLRAVELLVEAGLSPLEAIQVATLNGAHYLGIEDTLGTIEVGKVADLIVVNGDPAAKISDIRKIELVFKDGIAFDSQKLFSSVKGTVGLK